MDTEGGNAIAQFMTPQQRGSTLGQKAYASLCADIAGGRMMPGARVTLRGLASTLNVSMQPVREAVSKLIADELLELSNARVVRVPRLTPLQLRELWSVRLLIEGELAYLCACNATDAQIDQLERNCQTMLDRLLDPEIDVLRLLPAIYGNGLSFALGSGNALLSGLASTMRLRAAPHIAEALSQPAPMDKGFVSFTAQLSRETLYAVRARDPDRTRHLRCVDLQTFQRMIFERLGIGDPAARETFDYPDGIEQA